MSKPSSCFWFEAVTRLSAGDTPDATWTYCVGTGDNIPVVLVTGADDYTACARARLITKALNEEAWRALNAARADEEGD